MYLYSNILGTFVFSQNFRMREKVLFSDEEMLKHFPLLEEGKTLPTEERFLEKFKNIRRPEGDELVRIHKELEEYADEMRRKNILLTKHQVKASVTPDQLIMQTSDALQEYKKIINTMAKRLREWYALYLPEMEAQIDDHRHFAELVLKDRKKLLKDFKIKDSMGADLEKKDVEQMQQVAKQILVMYELLDGKDVYLEGLMQRHCPNITAVAGYRIGAKLLRLAGGLRDMVMMPASTIQLLGAEKALFRHMRTNARPPKHGIIIEHQLLQQAKKSERGRAARMLADKLGLAAKIDFFKGEFIGDKLLRELEEKL